MGGLQDAFDGPLRPSAVAGSFASLGPVAAATISKCLSGVLASIEKDSEPSRGVEPHQGAKATTEDDHTLTDPTPTTTQTEGPRVAR